MGNYGLGQSNAVEDVFAQPYSDLSSFNSLQKRNGESETLTDSDMKYNNFVSQTSIDNVRNHVLECDQIVRGLLEELDTNLHLVNINPYISINLEVAHKAVWLDATKHLYKTTEIRDDHPPFICYEEYIFAQRHQCRACREFVKEYEIAISHSSYGHLMSIKKILELLRSEILLVKNIVIYYLEEEYKDETEAEIAKHLADWAKTVTNYTKQFAKEITTKPILLPQSELDQITKKQAAQFQAFFSLRVNSFSSEINSITNLIKRDSVDIGETFYNNFLMPALTFKSKLIEPIMLDINTGYLPDSAPTLTGEMIIASNAIVGNLGAVTADLVERRIIVGKRLNALLQIIRQKVRYTNYIIQLENMAIQRPKTLVSPAQEDITKYNDLFESIEVDVSKRESLRSSHNDLDDLDGNPHPQYIKSNGGIISGDLFVEEGVTIAGINLANHSHNSIDGSNPISANSIDYESARQDYYENYGVKPYSNLVLTNLEYVQKVGGGHEYNATFEIEIDEDKLNAYEFEILYKEL